MPVPTSLSVITDNSEYSRYEPNFDTISATITAQGGAPYTSVPLRIDIVKARRNRDAVVTSKSIAFTSATDPALTATSFYLPDIVDQDAIHLMRHGQYFIRAVYEATSAVASIGSGANGVVTVVAPEGTDGNDYTISVAVPAGTSTLYADVVGTAITVYLATELGVPINTENNAIAVAAVLRQILPEFTVSYSGNGSGIFSVASSPVSFTGGTDEVIGESPDFNVRVITVARLKNEWLFGIDLKSTRILKAKFGLSSITGVEIVETSSDHPKGVFVLNYTYSAGPPVLRMLSWNGGPSVPIIAGKTTYVLRSGNGTGPAAKVCSGGSGSNPNYIVVRIPNPNLLPTQNVSEEVLMDYAQIDDEILGGFIDKALSTVENQLLHVYVEPTIVTTDADQTSIQYSQISPVPIYSNIDYDFLTSPLTYFLPQGGSWIHIRPPFYALLRVDSLFGVIANTRVIDIDLEWIHFAPLGGFIQLVPFNQETAFNYIGLLGVNALRGAAEIPSFWHYLMIAGLRSCPPELLELIGKMAAIEALTVASLAFRPGIGSMSLSRDGVSQSMSFNTQAQYGIYTSTIQAYKDWMDQMMPIFKGKYHGLKMVVV